jgi:serine protease
MIRPRSLPILAAGTLTLLGLLTPSPAAAGEPAGDPSSRWDEESSWDIPGEYLVDFEDGAERAAIDGLLASLGVGFRPTELEASTRIEIASIPEAGAAAILAALRADPRVEHVEPNARVRALFVPDDPLYRQQWHLGRVGAERAWELSIARGVTVAVIDTGVACETVDGFHKATDLAETRCVAGRSFVRGNAKATDDHGHGTHVAGTIAQSTDNALGASGVAFGARLMPVKVLSADGWGTTSAVADGIRWAADNGAQVINLSLGGPRNSLVLQRAVDHARSRGVVVVAAAGNSGGRVGYPGGCRGVVGVSATDQGNALAWFSSRGPEVDLAAPGVGVVQQTVCEHGRNRCELFPAFNGTSMASPHVAAAAALLVGLGVTDPAAVEDRLRSAARKLDGDPDGHKFGGGLLQAGAAAIEVVTRQLVARALATLALMLLAFRWARRRGQTVAPSSPLPWLGALTTGVGLLFFAPWMLSRHHFWVDLLSRPLGEWDLLASASLHRFLPLANIAVPLGLAVLLLSVRRAAGLIAGVAVGTAGYLCSVAALGELGTPFGRLVTVLWCLLNALGCVFLASLLLGEKRA